jgi:hypothetical protein
MATTTRHHGPIRLLCFECMDYWGTKPAPAEDCPYCDLEEENAAGRRAEGRPALDVSEHEDTYLCFACQAGRSPVELAELGYTPEANAFVTPWSVRLAGAEDRLN